ncbi:MAG: archaellin/type IV pilin N-terminal domain-containing protein [Nanopusillaceae archaeon]
MKGISPIIATILLIVMTVAIAGLMYAWLMGLFGSLTTASSNQASQATQIVSFTVPQVYSTNVSGTPYIVATVYNNGNVPIVNSSSLTIIAQEYYTANQTFDGVTYNCVVANTSSLNIPISSTYTILSGSQGTWVLDCTSSTNNYNDSSIYYNSVISKNNYYVFTFTYHGVSVQATLT